ncbi:MAG TPA: hypothetical protein VGJ57_04000 [Nitrospirales bacterium]
MQFFYMFLLSVAGTGFYVDRSFAVRINGDLNEFNGYTMEAPLSLYPDLKQVKTWSTDFVKEVGLYENPQEPPIINGTRFTAAQYRFADSRLESINLEFEGRENRDRLLKWIEQHYGKLLPIERKMINQVEWHGDRLTIALSYNPETTLGRLWFISPTLHHLVNKNINDMTE